MVFKKIREKAKKRVSAIKKSRFVSFVKEREAERKRFNLKHPTSKRKPTKVKKELVRLRKSYPKKQLKTVHDFFN